MNNYSACQSYGVIIACGYICFYSDYLWLTVGEIPWLQMNGVPLHMGGRTGGWKIGCEDEWLGRERNGKEWNGNGWMDVGGWREE